MNTGVLCVDTETTIFNNGNPYDTRNKCVCYSWADEKGSGAEIISEESIASLQRRIDSIGIFIGFNCKFDCHWLWNLGINFPDGMRVWDCQLAQFIISRQKNKYPSLEASLIEYNLGHKIDVVKEQFWDKGINTDQIPWEILGEYAKVDAEKTYQLYIKQQEIMSATSKRLLNLQGLDLLVLAEMERNGLLFDKELCEERAKSIAEEISEIHRELSGVYKSIPLNFSSGDDLSAFLYGGSVTEVRKEHIGFFKSGQRIGEPRYRNVEVVHELPRLVTPLPRSELKKQGYWATNKDTLLKLKPSRKTKHIIELIQRQTRLETLLSKSYNGIRKANEEQNWEPGWLHGQFNQVTVSTGRLSSSNPNMQNIDGQALDLFVSRYND